MARLGTAPQARARDGSWACYWRWRQAREGDLERNGPVAAALRTRFSAPTRPAAQAAGFPTLRPKLAERLHPEVRMIVTAAAQDADLR